MGEKTILSLLKEVGYKKRITGQEVNGHNRTGGHSFLFSGFEMILFYHSKSKVSALGFNIELLPSKEC